MLDALLVVVWKHRLDHGQRVYPPAHTDFVGVVMLPEDVGLEDRLQAAIRKRFGCGEFTCLPDPPTRERLTALGWGPGGLAITVA